MTAVFLFSELTMKNFIKIVSLISKLCGIASACMILLSVLVVMEMIWVRFVLVESTYWQTEFVTYLLIAATFIGSPYVLHTRGHVNVDLLPIYLTHRKRVYLYLISSFLALVFCLLITWLGYNFWLEAWEKDWHSDSIWGVRLWIPYASMPFGFMILSLQYVADIISILQGKEMPFGIADDQAENVRGEKQP